MSLKDLEVLNLEQNNISDVSTLSALNNLTTLNLSNNTAIKDITPITYLKNLTELRLNGDVNIQNLLSTLCVTETLADKTKVPRLINLKILYLNDIGKYSNMINSLSALANLEELFLSGNGITTINNMYKLEKLHTLDLSNNNIKNNVNNNNGFVKIVTKDDITYIEAQNHIKWLNLSNNGITYIDGGIGYMTDSIEWLNLQSNAIYEVGTIEQMYNLDSNDLFLQNQSIEVAVKLKNVSEQKIILGTLIQNSKKSTSKLYEKNADFTVEGATLNTDDYTYGNQKGNYNTPGIYNIVFSTDVKANDTGTVRISGGRAAGSIIVFKLVTSSSSLDSIVFEDYNLTRAIDEDLKARGFSVNSVPYILNITNRDINRVTELDLHNEGIKNVKGLESFANLQILNLARNNISSNNSVSKIDMLKNLSKMIDINLSENQLENADVITNYKDIQIINIANNKNISNLQDFNKWKTNLGKSKSKLVEINASYNNISDLEPIKDITTLVNLNVGANKISEIKHLENLTNLEELNISNNKIIEINTLEKLINLRTLNMSNNKIKDISSVWNLGLLKILNISNNRIDSLEGLGNLPNLIELKVNNNKVDTTEAIQYLDLIKNPELNYQKIFHQITEEDKGIIKVELPKLFKEAKDEDSKIYTTEDFIFNNCNLSSDGEHIEVNVDELGNNIAYVTIDSGNAHGSQFSIARPVQATITYSIETRTKGPVIATISFDRNASIINNDGKNTYSFEENGEFTFEYEDEYGFSGTTTAKVDWIDNEGPQISIKYSEKEITAEDVLVKLTANEECKLVDGWTLSSDKKVLSKTYETNTSEDGEKLIVEDDLGNTTEVIIKILNIDKDAPIVTGVEDGEVYTNKVTPEIVDNNLDTVELTKDGIKVEYNIGDTLAESGKYTLTAKDKAGNTTRVSFEIKLESDIPVELIIKDSSDYTKYEENNINYVQYVAPKTTMEKFLNNFETTGTLKVYKGTQLQTNKSVYIGTGMKIILEKDGQKISEHVIITKGDITGDGEADFKDILQMNKHRLGGSILKNEKFKAGDITQDGLVDFRGDILKLNKFRLGRISSL